MQYDLWILNFKAFGKYYFLQCQKSVGKKVNPYEMYYLGNLEKQGALIIRTTYCLLKISSRHRLRRLSIKIECQAGKKEKDYWAELYFKDTDLLIPWRDFFIEKT